MSFSAIRTSAAAAVLAATAIAGSAVVTAGPAQAACVNRYVVMWSVAGVYDAPGGNVVADKHYGDLITGPCVWGSPWTMVYRANGTIAYMRQAALTPPAPR